MAKVVDLAEAILVETATMGKRLQWSDGQASAGGGAYLGITCDVDFAAGCKIRSVQAGAPAAEAGLETGDVIIGWNEQEIGSMSDLVKRVRQAKPGVTVALRVRRGEQELSVEVLLGKK
jgi:S1-C subfamily serine protease